MLTEADLAPKQTAAIDRLCNHDRSILVAATGDGKTVICLTAIRGLIDKGRLTRVIIACPAKVRGVWPKEAEKWEHLAGLKVEVLEGDNNTRSNALHLSDANVIVVSLNSLDWLLREDHGANGVVIDELSKAAGKQTKALKAKNRGDCFVWRVGMTATPVSQDFLKLYGMCRIIDGGQALGRNKQAYEDAYFSSDYSGFRLTLRGGADKVILERVRGLIHMVQDNKVEELPPLIKNRVRFEMPSVTREHYNDMKREMIADDIEAANSAVQSGKLRQLASGFLYDLGPNGERTFDVRRYDYARFYSARDWAINLQRRRGIIFYEFIEQLNELLQFQTSHTNDIDKFLTGQDQLLLAQISSLSHGVEGLQLVCHDVLLYQPMWSRDATEQAIGRVWRKGQKQPVTVTTLVCDDTLDYPVVQRVNDRGHWMELFKRHLKS